MPSAANPRPATWTAAVTQASARSTGGPSAVSGWGFEGIALPAALARAEFHTDEHPRLAAAVEVAVHQHHPAVQVLDALGEVHLPRPHLSAVDLQSHHAAAPAVPRRGEHEPVVEHRRHAVDDP